MTAWVSAIPTGFINNAAARVQMYALTAVLFILLGDYCGSMTSLMAVLTLSSMVTSANSGVQAT
jgi:hypothetical protein